jgi:hypothetical protein
MDDRSVIGCKRCPALSEGILPCLAADKFCLFFDR